MGWDALELWGKNVARIERLAGGVANDVWSLRVDGRRAVGRLGTRSDADLAWAKLTERRKCVVHGDPNVNNIRLTTDRVAMIDWDECRVDVPDLDLVLPGNAADLDDGWYDTAAQASAAWEAAVCWDDDYAVRRLAEVRAI